MPTTGPINGTLYKITVAGTSIDSLTSNSVSFSNDTRDVTTKDSGGFREILATITSASYSAEGVVALDDAYATEELYDAFIAKVAVAVVFTTAVTGDVQWTQQAILTSCEIDAPMEDNVTFSVSMEGTGAITKSDVV
jgi:TP901-1 family phage major tail protein